MSFTVACLKLAETFRSSPPRGAGASSLSGARLAEVQAAIRPILLELEELRRETIRKIDLRAAWMIPIGIGAGFIGGLILNDDSPVFGALGYAFVGGAAGWGAAFTSLNNAYRRAYKTRVIPHLTACFGELDYRPAEEPDLKRLAKLGILPGFGKKRVEDEIFGAYNGVELKVVEANLETGGKNSTVVFNGLVAELAFPGRFPGTTIVAKDTGMFGNALRDFIGAAGLERVRLEDPRFEDRYQVYSNDQISARALLTPATMERLMELDGYTGGEPPRLLAEDGVLRLALFKDKKENLFEPPSIADSAAGTDMLLKLSSDISSVVKFVDAVLELSPVQMTPRSSR
jgi:hypothetical protein